jgi:hypothetical protein
MPDGEREPQSTPSTPASIRAILVGVVSALPSGGMMLQIMWMHGAAKWQFQASKRRILLFGVYLLYRKRETSLRFNLIKVIVI